MGAEVGEVFVDVAAAEEDFAVVGLDHPGDHLDGGGLAGAVGAQVAEDFAFAEGKADVLDGGDGAIALGGVADFQHRSLVSIASRSPTLAGKTNTRRGWGTQCCF